MTEGAYKGLRIIFAQDYNQIEGCPELSPLFPSLIPSPGHDPQAEKRG